MDLVVVKVLPALNSTDFAHLFFFLYLEDQMAHIDFAVS
jgi:hypothetical protein